MTFGELVDNGTLEDVELNLRKLQAELGYSTLKIRIVSKDDYTGYALQKLGLYASGQIENLISSLGSPIEFKAWISRNLFEAYLTGVYIVSNPSNAKDFVIQKASDELDIYKGILTISSTTDTSEVRKPVEGRIEHIRSTMIKHGLEYSKSLNISVLADRTGNKDEYNAFYKFYSKYVHPTSWSIISEVSERDNPTFINVFLMQSQYYVSLLQKSISDFNNKQT